jgi:hypothetical protein
VTEATSSTRDLHAFETCDPASPSTPATVLTWQPGTEGTRIVAVATLPDGFATDRYAVTEPLPIDQTVYGLSPVEPGGIYYWRVLVSTEAGWQASEIATFSGPTCILDSPSAP